MRTLLATVLALAACAPAPRPEPRAEPGALFASGEIRGYLEPCGCNRPQLGGLPRRGTALAGAPFVENGDLVAGPGRLNEIKFETLLVALSDLGCRALNVGDGELSLGIDFLKSAEGLARFPFLSANVLGEDGKPAFAPGATIFVAGRPWWVMGLIDPEAAPGHAVAPADDALSRALAARPNEGHPTVLLFHGPRAAATKLIAIDPHAVDFVVCTSEDGEPDVGDGRIVTPGDRGRRLVRLARAPTLLTLDEGFADEPRMTRRIREYVERIATEDLLRSSHPAACSSSAVSPDC